MKTVRLDDVIVTKITLSPLRPMDGLLTAWAIMRNGKHVKSSIDREDAQRTGCAVAEQNSVDCWLSEDDKLTLLAEHR